MKVSHDDFTDVIVVLSQLADEDCMECEGLGDVSNDDTIRPCKCILNAHIEEGEEYLQ